VSESAPNPGGAVLDTSAAVELLGGDERTETLIREFSLVHLPHVVLDELWYGAYRSGKIEDHLGDLDHLLAMTGLLLPDEATAEAFGRLKNQLRAKGRPIPENDLRIAAISVPHDLILLARDAHFDQIEGLAVRSW
jgi:tRNA(fMet)-specific endonuclease VapC